jgi:hypothetical protein
MTLTRYAIPFSHRSGRKMPAPTIEGRYLTTTEYETIRANCELLASSPTEEQYCQRIPEHRMDILYIVNR